MKKQDSTSRAEESKRMWACAAFAGVLIVIGLPLWWQTTQVYRVPLPYNEINALYSESHYITTELRLLADDDETGANMLEQIQYEFQQYDAIKLKIHIRVMTDDLHKAFDVANEIQLVDEISKWFNLNMYNTFYVVQRKKMSQDIWVGTERIAFFRDAEAVPTLIEALKTWIYQPTILAGARSEAADAARRVRFPNAPSYHLVLSVVHPTPQLMKVDFNAAKAAEDYLGNFAAEIADVHSLTFSSQWIHFLDFDFEPKAADGVWWVPTERLPLLVTQLEARSATHVSDRATINLAIYVAPCAVSPLIIHEGTSEPRIQTFLSPKWGSVIIVNPTKEDCKQKTFKPDVHKVMGSFALELRQLLGITIKNPINGVELQCRYNVGPRLWELDGLLRIKTLEQISSAERTLKSLAKLLGEISNIVINEEVGASVWRALFNIERSKKLMRDGQLKPAHDAARDAFLAANTAFNDPSLLALLYFPDDQKYAIYIPLFLPIMLPVLLSLKKLVQWLRGKHENDEPEKKLVDANKKKTN